MPAAGEHRESLPPAITHRTFARAGLFGNPSDQYGGRTIAFSLANFYAEVTLTPSLEHGGIRFQPHPLHDSTEYGSLADLVVRTSTQGLYGGLRLLMATCKRFGEHCSQHGIPLQQRLRRPPSGGSETAETVGTVGFSLSYITNVPRQTGLAGSSAIIYSTLKCLMQWYGVSDAQLPPAARPGLVLSVEAAEMGIAAGLQDRVVQVYGGAVHMDFGPSAHAAAQGGGGGCYSRLDPRLLPQPLLIMFSENPSESGKVHSGVKAKWIAGDPEVRALMARVAGCADAGLRLLTTPPEALPDRAQQLVDLMNQNFDLRRALFGDAVLGARNLRMVEIARSVGAGVNFTGSGGAVAVFAPGGEPQVAALRAAAEAEAFSLVAVQLGPDNHHLPPPPPPPAEAAAAVALSS